MSNFQSSINQMLGTAGALATFSPQLQEHAKNMVENRKIKKEEKVLKEQVEAGLSNGNALNPQVEEDVINRSRELARRKFELNPSKETYKEYTMQLPGEPIKEDPEIIHQEEMESIPDLARRNAEYNYAYKQAYGRELSNLEAQQQAMDRMYRQKEAKKALRRNFTEYLAKQPTSLGGTVGDLPPEAQKQIASQYTKSQRRTMMDKMDEEAMKSGK